MLKKSIVAAKRNLKKQIYLSINTRTATKTKLKFQKSNPLKLPLRSIDLPFKIENLRFFRLSKTLQLNFSKTKQIRIETGENGQKIEKNQKPQISNNFVRIQNVNPNTNQASQISKQEPINYLNIYLENKKKLAFLNPIQQHKKHPTQKEEPNIFNQQYLIQNFLQTKYFYSDIVNVATTLIEDLLQKIESPIKQQQIISSTHLHFLLYTYHLYPKEAKNFKQRMIKLIDHFFDNEQEFLKDFKIEKNMEFLVYFRKFIETQAYQHNGNEVGGISQKYCLSLKRKYQREKFKFAEGISSPKNKSQTINQLTLKSQLLHDYMLAFPNVWILSDNSENQYQSHQKYQKRQLKVSEQILLIYDDFLKQFSELFTKSISQWLEGKIQIENQLNNFSYKRTLFREFKELQVDKCLNQIKIIIHRLFAIIRHPKASTTQKNMSKYTQKKQEAQTSQQFSLQIINQKYIHDRLNILSYLPSQKLNLDDYQKMMRLLILAKSIFTYHVIRNVKKQQLTKYLAILFENNQALIHSENLSIKREMKFLIGELISKLCSGSWVDNDDELNIFVENIVNSQEKKKKPQKETEREFYQVK